MSRLLLTPDSDWELTDSTQDVRGFAAIDARGDQVGTVAGLVVDTDSELVSAILLDSGDEVPTLDVAIGDRVVYLAGAIPGAATVPDVPEALVHHRVVRREVVPAVEIVETVIETPHVVVPHVVVPHVVVPQAAPQAAAWSDGTPVR